MENNKIKYIYTDLIVESNTGKGNNNIIYQEDSICVKESFFNKKHYTTIFFDDIIDSLKYKKVQDVFVRELKKYLNLKKKEKILVIGLGNEKSTPDSLGPSTVKNILITRYLFLLGDVEEGYQNVSAFTPDVMGNTGIETSHIVKKIVDEVKPTKVIVIDSLKSDHIERINRTIQITDKGIHPGSGINNVRKEISFKTIGVDVIAIGVPTVVNLCSIIKQSQKNISLGENLIVTPTNIDFMIEKLSILIGNGINISLHDNFIRQ